MTPVILRLPDGTSRHGSLTEFPRKGEEVNLAGLGYGKVKTVRWIYHVTPESGLIPYSAEIELEDWKRLPKP